MIHQLENKPVCLSSPNKTKYNIHKSIFNSAIKYKLVVITKGSTLEEESGFLRKKTVWEIMILAVWAGKYFVGKKNLPYFLIVNRRKIWYYVSKSQRAWGRKIDR